MKTNVKVFPLSLKTDESDKRPILGNRISDNHF